jgi:hypothetical protein
MSVLGRLVRFTLRPAFRAAEQMRESSQRLSLMRQQQREQVQQHLQELRQQVDANGADLGPGARFERLYQERGWTPQTLAQQLVAVRRTKLAAIIGVVLGTAAGIVLLMMAPLWALVLFVPAVAGLTALGVVSTLKYGLFQAQLEQRQLIGLTQYLCRTDLFSHLLGTEPKPTTAQGAQAHGGQDKPR